LQPFAHVRLMIGRGRQDHAAGVATIHGFQELRASVSNFFLASSLVELVLRCNVPGAAAAHEFLLLSKALRVVADSERQKEKVLAVRIFLWKLLSLSGWHPNIEQCARCRKPLTGTVHWYEDLQGFICSDHASGSVALPNEFLPFLGHVLIGEDWQALMLEAEERRISKEWFEVSQRFYQDVISEPIVSLKMLAYV